MLRLPGSESTISMPLARAKRNQLVRSAAVPDRDPAAPVARIRAIVERLMAEGSMVAKSDGSTRDVRRFSITAGEGEALARWVLRERATRTIEIGLAYGVSA